MAQRVYERQQKHWEQESLQALAREGRAEHLWDHDIWIVQLDEGGKVAVRPAQILVNGVPLEAVREMEADQAKAEMEAEAAYERHLEDRGYWEARADEDYERSMGIVSFSDAMAAAEREFDRQELLTSVPNAHDLLAQFSPPKEI